MFAVRDETTANKRLCEVPFPMSTGVGVAVKGADQFHNWVRNSEITPTLRLQFRGQRYPSDDLYALCIFTVKVALHIRLNGVSL
jgi:hypothetical protein